MQDDVKRKRGTRVEINFYDFRCCVGLHEKSWIEEKNNDRETRAVHKSDTLLISTFNLQKNLLMTR